MFIRRAPSTTYVYACIFMKTLYLQATANQILKALIYNI